MSKKKNKKIWYDVHFEFSSNRYFAKTPEGAVKQHFKQIKKPIPPVDVHDGGWKGVSVTPVGGYTKIWSIKDVY